MLNYEEELKKFKPALDVDEVENAVYGSDIKDVIDLLLEVQAGNDKTAAARGTGRN